MGRGGKKPKGTPNKPTLDFFTKCEKLKHDPIAFNIAVAKGDWRALGYEKGTETQFNKFGDELEVDRITVDHRLAANNKLLEFMYPKRRSIDFSPFDDDENNNKGFVLAYNLPSLETQAKKAKILELNKGDENVIEAKTTKDN